MFFSVFPARRARFSLPIIVLTALSLLLGNHFSVQAASPFVGRSGTHFILNDKPFYFAGANNYYPIYGSHQMVDDFLMSAQAQGLKVVRIWAMIDIGSLDGSIASTDGQKDNTYFQYWDTSASAPAYNDGENGLQRLDYALKRAADFDLKVIPVLINNWSAFGGIDQYDKWYGLADHDAFYSNAKTQEAYKSWVKHVITRTNGLTGVAYLNDPTVFAWELANEPRCKGSGALPTSATCNTSTVTNWVSMMSGYIKNLDANHMVTVGDEGFFNRAGSPGWPYSGGEGVDTEAFMKLATIDFGTYHLYPQDWGVDENKWPVQWITDHIAAGNVIGKPVILEEFGSKPLDKRDPLYYLWTYTVCTNGGAGWMYWILSGHQSDGTYYPDYDGYNVNDTQSTYTLLATAAKNMNTQQCGTPPPTPTLAPTPLVANTATPTSPPGTKTVDDSIIGTEDGQFNYSGTGWTHCTNCNETSPAVFYNASQSWDSTTDDTVTVAFTGVQITYRAVVGPTHGMAAVSIDGGSETIVDLYGPTKTGDTAVWTSPVLSDGSHKLTIRVAGQKNPVSTSNVITLDRVDITAS